MLCVCISDQMLIEKNNVKNANRMIKLPKMLLGRKKGKMGNKPQDNLRIDLLICYLLSSVSILRYL